MSIARALSKLGAYSRSEGERLVVTGRVRVNGEIVRSIGTRVTPEADRIDVDGAPVVQATLVYLALNKPRGLVTTRVDPQGRATIDECRTVASLPFLGPVGRLDKASEGLLLLTNDSQWAHALLDPASHVEKTYHVQVRGDKLERVCGSVGAGLVESGTGESLTVRTITLLRTGSRRTAWFEIVLDEGKNRQLRRIFTELGVEVVRLVRVAIGPLPLGDIAKGEWRFLTDDEVRSLGSTRR